MCTILIAEDNSVQLEITLGILENTKENYQLIAALDGLAAYNLAIKQQPDLILMDWLMPNLSGIESIKKLKSDSRTQHIPIIIITGKESDENLQTALDAGAIDFIQKPFPKTILLSRIKVALALSESQEKQNQYHNKVRKQNKKLAKLNKKLANVNQALIDSELQYRKIYENTPVMLHSVNTKGELIGVNSYWLGKMGYQKKEVLGKKIADFLVENFEPSVCAKSPCLEAKGECSDISIQLITKENKKIDALASSFLEKNKKGETIQSLVVISDVTERLEAEKKLKSFKNGLQTLNFISSDATLDFDKQLTKSLSFMTKYYDMQLGVISKIEKQDYIINTAFSDEEAYQLKKGEVFQLGETYCGITYRGRAVLAINYMKKSKYAKHPCYEKFNLESYIGVPIWVNGKKFGTIGLSSPIPRKINFNEYDLEFMQMFGRWVSFTLERQRNMQKLIDINDSQDRILATVAHDLRSPFNSVLGISSIFKLQMEECCLAGDKKQMFDMIDQSCEKGLYLIGELLEIAELENEEFQLETAKTEINDFVQKVITPLEVAIKEKNIDIIYELAKDEIFANINYSKFSRVIENLVINAKKFTPIYGKITIKTALKNQRLLITISDTGIGIPEHLQPIIFDKFSKARRAGLKGEKSTGLGMSIVKQILDYHKGKIWLESEVNKGTTFFISIPLI